MNETLLVILIYVIALIGVSPLIYCYYLSWELITVKELTKKQKDFRIEVIVNTIAIYTIIILVTNGALFKLIDFLFNVFGVI